MSTINVTLSQPLEQFVARQVAYLECTDSSEYVEQLIEADLERQRQVDEHHWQLVQEGLASGTPVSADEFWQQVHKETERRRQEHKIRSNQ
ncbi:MAG: hypothetical protein LBT89_11535 [Planctomycetaceae bacterium]|jgi:Arc/MetJ-type ribon-helix-helix transcriptional regulator|nr:hypothetical protein [Planctomycetaceae bacterium]